MAAYRKEKTILGLSFMLCTFLLVKYVPRDKVRHASVIFLFTQVLTWLLGLLVVEKNLIEYPYRFFFKKTYKGSFCFEYIFYPVLSVLFNLYYPEKRNYFIKSLHYFFYTAFITVSEIFIVKYTKLIHYKNWTWYWSFITLWFTYYLSHIYDRWLLKGHGDKLGQ